MSLPIELENYIQTLAPSSQNNSREIVRNAWRRGIGKHPLTRLRILESIGISPSIDYQVSDEGNEPPNYQSK